MINGISKENSNTLWIGTHENGVNVVNESEIINLKEENSDIINDNIQDITIYNNKVFIGTNEGLSVVDISESGNYNITNYTKDNGLPSNKIRSLFIDSKGFLWIGTNKGVACFDTSNGQVTDLTSNFKDIGLSDKFVRAVYEDSKGNYYIGCLFDGGLIKVNPNTREYKIYTNDENDTESISSNNIRYITEDLDGNILVGTSYGINILDPSTDKFKHYTENDGLINNTIYGILVDKYNNIWMSTNGGISQLSLKDQSFKNFTVADGLQCNEFNGGSCYKDQDGFLYFGGINGFNIIDSDAVAISEFKPKVIFDSFEVNGISRKDISNTKLKYNENNIKINFFSDDYKNNKNNKYYYRLSGKEDNWKTINGNSLIFPNLVAGKYNLEIKTTSQHGVESEINNVSFTIKPPFWKSNLAKIICCVVIIIVTCIYRNKVIALDQLVDRRTLELREQMEKNQKLFNQVLELEQSKNNYFVNLSHELKTPLNVLNSINQVIKSYTVENKVIPIAKLDYYMDVMDRNGKRLLTFINNLIDYEKIENNNYILNKEDTNVVYLVEETALEMKDYIEEKGIEFIFDTDVEEKIIECDKLDIERCVINLVSNAVKFTPSGGLIEVTLKDLEDKVKISVKDNGEGISIENQKVIFDRFNQGIDKCSEKKGGSGLGLTITKQIVNLHGGEIYVKSEVGKGSEFVIILPNR
ncbi:MAG: ATP-binding protein [Clostridiaceae bacterium]|nr:ATP-binding protein [Clostridiaceae bacterium]